MSNFLPVGVTPEQYERMKALAKWRERSTAGEVRFALAAYLRREWPKYLRAMEKEGR